MHANIQIWNKNKVKFGNIIRDHRNGLGFTLDEYGEMIGIPSHTVLWRLEAGQLRKPPELWKVERFAKALNISDKSEFYELAGYQVNPNEILKKSFGKYLKDAREKLGISSETLGNLINIPGSTLSHVEQDQHNLSDERKERIVDFFNKIDQKTADEIKKVSRMNKNDFKHYLKSTRAELGISQTTLADALGIEQTHVSRIETEKTNPSKSQMVNVAMALANVKRNAAIQQQPLKKGVQATSRSKELDVFKEINDEFSNIRAELRQLGTLFGRSEQIENSVASIEGMITGLRGLVRGLQTDQEQTQKLTETVAQLNERISALEKHQMWAGFDNAKSEEHGLIAGLRRVFGAT